MIYLDNYKLFIDKRKSKSGKDYCALFLEIDNKEFVVCFINSSLYDYLANLSA